MHVSNKAQQGYRVRVGSGESFPQDADGRGCLANEMCSTFLLLSCNGRVVGCCAKQVARDYRTAFGTVLRLISIVLLLLWAGPRHGSECARPAKRPVRTTTFDSPSCGCHYHNGQAPQHRKPELMVARVSRYFLRVLNKSIPFSSRYSKSSLIFSLQAPGQSSDNSRRICKGRAATRSPLGP